MLFFCNFTHLHLAQEVENQQGCTTAGLWVSQREIKGNKALKSEILSRSSPHFLISRHDLKMFNQNWGSMFGDSKQINWEAGNSNQLFLSNFLEMTCSQFLILRLYYLYILWYYKLKFFVRRGLQIPQTLAAIIWLVNGYAHWNSKHLP